MKLKLLIVFIMLYFGIVINTYASPDHIYKQIAFSVQPIKKNNEYVGSKIQVRKVNYSEGESPEPGEIIWTIGADNLPVDADLCDQYTFDSCSGPECIAPCLCYGPEFINYDEKNNIVYFSVNSSAVGTTGMGLRFVFSGDINKKEIKYLSLISGPLKTTLSPRNQYLLFYGLSKITILDTKTNKLFHFGKDNIWRSGHKRLYALSNIHWLNDTRFTYTESWRENKFSPKSNDIIEHIYDIPTRKIISSRKIQDV